MVFIYYFAIPKQTLGDLIDTTNIYEHLESFERIALLHPHRSILIINKQVKINTNRI
jgi:hypothetical protein